MVPKRYSVVTASAPITMSTIIPKLLPNCVEATVTTSDSENPTNNAVNPDVVSSARTAHHHGERVEVSLIRSMANNVIVSVPEPVLEPRHAQGYPSGTPRRFLSAGGRPPPASRAGWQAHAA